MNAKEANKLSCNSSKKIIQSTLTHIYKVISYEAIKGNWSIVYDIPRIDSMNIYTIIDCLSNEGYTVVHEIESKQLIIYWCKV